MPGKGVVETKGQNIQGNSTRRGDIAQDSRVVRNDSQPKPPAPKPQTTTPKKS